MASRRVYSNLVLTYSGTKIVAGLTPQLKNNLVTDKDYVPPIINHPICVDSTVSLVLKIDNIVPSGRNFKVTVSISERINVPLTFTGKLTITSGGIVPLSGTFSGTIQPGNTQVTVTSSAALLANSQVIRSGIVSFSPTTYNGKTITNFSSF